MSMAISSMTSGSHCTVTAFCWTLTVRRSSTPEAVVVDVVRVFPRCCVFDRLVLEVREREDAVAVPSSKMSRMLLETSLASAHLSRKVCSFRLSHF